MHSHRGLESLKRGDLATASEAIYKSTDQGWHPISQRRRCKRILQCTGEHHHKSKGRRLIRTSSDAELLHRRFGGRPGERSSVTGIHTAPDIPGQPRHGCFNNGVSRGDHTNNASVSPSAETRAWMRSSRKQTVDNGKSSFKDGCWCWRCKCALISEVRRLTKPGRSIPPVADGNQLEKCRWLKVSDSCFGATNQHQTGGLRFEFVSVESLFSAGGIDINLEISCVHITQNLLQAGAQQQCHEHACPTFLS